MVAVKAVLFVNMQRDAAMGRQGLEEFAHQFGVKTADLLRRKVQVADQIGAGRQIKRAGDLGVIHRQSKVAIAPDALFVAQGLGQGLANRDAHIFDRVVIVDVQISFAVKSDVKATMLGQLRKNVIEKS